MRVYAHFLKVLLKPVDVENSLDERYAIDSIPLYGITCMFNARQILTTKMLDRHADRQKD